MTDRTDLNVPFAEKDDAKALGAWWDPTARTWYVPAGKDPKPFEKWLPGTGEVAPAADHLLDLKPPVFVVESATVCWKCGKSVAVATLASRGYATLDGEGEDQDGTLIVFSGIDWLTAPALAALRRVNPGYRERFSKTANCEYFMNHCPCGAQMGDFFMHSEPGGAFFPMDVESVARIKLRVLSEAEPMKLGGDPGSSWPNLIGDHAQRV